MSKEAIKTLNLKDNSILSILPKGAIKEIADRTGLNRNSVRMILLGVWSNEGVMICVREILERQQEQITVAIQEIAK